jgi:cob(I)alamin adenosyltransferase
MYFATAGRGRSADTTPASAGGIVVCQRVREAYPFVARDSSATVGRTQRTYNHSVKIYTKTGDAGETSLFGGQRVSKADARVTAYGDVDELNAWLGFVRANLVDRQLGEMLEHLQRDLFAVGARLADPGHKIADRVVKAAVTGDDVTRLEGWIDQVESELKPLRRFILAGGSPAGAALHVARTVCRRAERSMVSLGHDAFETDLLVYINRLSDLLFVMARVVNHRANQPETEW